MFFIYIFFILINNEGGVYFWVLELKVFGNVEWWFRVKIMINVVEIFGRS